MRRKRSKTSVVSFDRRYLMGGLALLALGLATINCSLTPNLLDAADSAGKPKGFSEATSVEVFAVENRLNESTEDKNEGEVLAEGLWADVTITDNNDAPGPAPANGIPDYMSLDVRDANLLDVLSLIAYKLDGNIIFLEEPSEITIKTSELSPITTLQTVLQKKGLDYLTIGRNYIVGDRERLYDDFANRMYLSRFNLFYVSSEAMEKFISDFGVPVEILPAASNEIHVSQQSIWMQGTPMALGKAREIINSLDVMENAAFGEGGSRQIRMPVAIASGPRAEDEMRSLINLLSVLLDGFRDDRTDQGWGTWDHPGPVPRIHMDWGSPVIRPHDIKMKITPDIDPDPGRYLHYLIAEGTPDNIAIVNEMIALIKDEGLLFRFPSDGVGEEEEDEQDVNDLYPPPIENEEQEPPDTEDANSEQGGQPEWSSAPVEAHSVSLNAVPGEGGRLSGRGSYITGNTVTVTAAPNEGYRFVRWIENGSELSTSSSFNFQIYSARNLEAVFLKINSTKTGADEDTAGEELNTAAENGEDEQVNQEEDNSDKVD